MKKILTYAMGALLLLGATACQNDGPLSAGAAKSALKDSPTFGKENYAYTFQTGFYEVTENQLDNLAKLKAAGVVDFTVETVTEYVQKSTYNWWTGYSYYTVEEQHTFATVSLTEAGLKYEVPEPNGVPKYLRKYFDKMKDYEEIVPDYMSAVYGNAAQPVAVDEEEVVVEEVAPEPYDSTEVAVAEEVVEEVVEPEPAPAPKKEEKADKNAAYHAMLDRVNTEDHYMLLGRFKLEKVLLVECTEEMLKNGKGSCTFVYTFVDKTPFGFVFGAPDLDAYKLGSATFKLYANEGWMVDDIDL